ncbi:MAG: hypothetical protein JAZ06_03585 [Candidatus Thiodiazotropha taylori]|nr:hypothetical protein [Candidatus Thiodiazotropha taylori]
MLVTFKMLLNTSLAVSLALIFNTGVFAEDQATDEIPPYQHSGTRYPPILLVTNINSPSMSDLLNKYHAFSRIDKEAVGLPIGVRILKLHRTKNDSMQFTTLMLAATTLGIVPVISNKEFKVRYDVFAQGEIVSTFTYQTNSTDANNIWMGVENENETKPDEELFIKESVSRFLSELKDSTDTQALFQEYREYYPSDS